MNEWKMIEYCWASIYIYVWYIVDNIWWLCLLEEILLEMKYSWRAYNIEYLVFTKILLDISSSKADELSVHVGFYDTLIVLLLVWIKLSWYTSSSELSSLTNVSFDRSNIF